MLLKNHVSQQNWVRHLIRMGFLPGPLAGPAMLLPACLREGRALFFFLSPVVKTAKQSSPFKGTWENEMGTSGFRLVPQSEPIPTAQQGSWGQRARPPHPAPLSLPRKGTPSPATPLGTGSTHVTLSLCPAFFFSSWVVSVPGRPFRSMLTWQEPRRGPWESF